MRCTALWIVALTFGFHFAGAFAGSARNNEYNNTTRNNALVQPGASYEGEGEIWTPTQNKEKSDVVKWHWKLTIKKVEGEKFTGQFEWVHNGTTNEKVEGTFVNGLTLTINFSKQDKGATAKGTIDNAGGVKFGYVLPSSDRIGEFSGTRVTTGK